MPFDANKLYASEILSILVQSSGETRKLLGEMDGIDVLLHQLAVCDCGSSWADWLIDWIIFCSIDRLIDWLIVRWIDWLSLDFTDEFWFNYNFDFDFSI